MQDTALTAFDKGRAMREVPVGLRRLLGQIDGERCQMPSCTRISNLHAHHVQYRSQGGRTDLAKVTLMCRWALIRADVDRTLRGCPDSSARLSASFGEHAAALEKDHSCEPP